MRIKESCMENTYGYHLSPYSFSEPKINYKAGFGTSFYGAGFYITLDKNVLDVIKGEAQDMFAEYFIYTIQVDENANIVDEDEDNGLQLYAELVEQFNGDEVKASAEMVKRGIDGLLYYSEEDGHSIVFYNPKMAKIVHTEYHEGWGERSELTEGKLKKAVAGTMLALALASAPLHAFSKNEYVSVIQGIEKIIPHALENHPGDDDWVANIKIGKNDWTILGPEAVKTLQKIIQKKYNCSKRDADYYIIGASLELDFDFANGTANLFDKDAVDFKLEKTKEAGIRKIGCW